LGAHSKRISISLHVVHLYPGDSTDAVARHVCELVQIATE